MNNGQKGWTVPYCSFKVMSLLSQFDQRGLVGLSEDEDIAEEWEVYCDGSWSWQDGCGGWGAVLSRNKLVVECSADSAGGMSGLQTEMNAIILGLQVAEKHCCVSATIYSDCIAAIWVLQRGEGQEGLTLESLSTLALRLLKDTRSWKLKHIFRDANCFADSLARKA